MTAVTDDGSNQWRRPTPRAWSQISARIRAVLKAMFVAKVRNVRARLGTKCAAFHGLRGWSGTRTSMLATATSRPAKIPTLPMLEKNGAVMFRRTHERRPRVRVDERPPGGVQPARRAFNATIVGRWKSA